MKKIILCTICLLLLVGCSKTEQNNNDNNENNFKIEKIDENKDIVYFNEYKKLIYNNQDYSLGYYVINLVGDNIDNVNLELKSFVTKAYKNMELTDDVVNKGYVINNSYHITDEYISIIQSYYPYLDGVMGEEDDNVYVISLKNGKVLDNKSVLKDFDMDEDKMYEKLESLIDSEDVSYTIMNIKKNGYNLYVNDDSKLVIIYYEVTDLDSERKEIIVN